MRRPSTISLVIPSSLNLKWYVGSSKGELMIGLSITVSDMNFSLDSKSFLDLVFLNESEFHVAVKPALEVQSRGMFSTVPPPTLVLTIRWWGCPPEIITVGFYSITKSQLLVCGLWQLILLPYLLGVISMGNPYQRVGLRIRVIRRQAGLTQAQLAEKADLSDNFIGLIERGEGHPTIQTINRIAEALGVRLGELFAGEDEPRGIDQILKELERLFKHRNPSDAQLVLSISKRVFEHFPARTKT